MTRASWVSLSRLFLVPMVILPVVAGWNHGWFISAFVAALAGLTDILDGYLARKTGQITPLGTNLDLISDKVFIGAMLVFMAWLRLIPMWIPIVVILREVIISFVRFVLFHYRPPESDVWGKTKTAFSFVAIILVLMQQELKESYSVLLSLTSWLMVVVAVLTVLSGINYLVRYGAFRARKQKSSVLTNFS